MSYKITIENTTDPTDKTEVEGLDAVIAFTGQMNTEKKVLEHGMLWAGNKRVMAVVIQNIPNQIMQLAGEPQEPTPIGIVAPNGQPIVNNKKN